MRLGVMHVYLSVCVCIVVAINGNTQKIGQFWDSCGVGGKSVVPWRKRQGGGELIAEVIEAC